MSQATQGVEMAMSCFGRVQYANSPREYQNFANRCTWPFPENKTDCSGFPTGILHGLNVPTPNYSMSSAAYAVWGHETNAAVPLAVALATPFCLVIKGPDQGEGGFGDLGHMGITTGTKDANGNPLIIEAQGHATDIVVGPFRSEFIYFMRVPGMSYLDAPTPNGEDEMHAGFLARVDGSAGVWFINGATRRGLTQEDIGLLNLAHMVDGVVYPIGQTDLLHYLETPRA